MGSLRRGGDARRQEWRPYDGGWNDAGRQEWRPYDGGGMPDAKNGVMAMGDEGRTPRMASLRARYVSWKDRYGEHPPRLSAQPCASRVGRRHTLIDRG